jgi:hypothetical protein
LNDDLHDFQIRGRRPIVVGPKPFSLEALLRNIDPAPDDETERFVAAIYEDRRQSAADPTHE